jgi:hypothetical protein
MSLIRIVASDLVSDQVHREALKENRTLSAMGLVLLREALAARRAAATQIAEVSKLVATIRGQADGYPQ